MKEENWDQSGFKYLAAQSEYQTQIDIAVFVTRPSIMLRAKVYKDGNMWCCLYGDNIQIGVCGFGETPDKACLEFDRTWMNGDVEK